MHVLDSNGTAISVPQPLKQLSQSQRTVVLKRFTVDRHIHVRFREAEKLRSQLGRNGARQAKWINLGDAMSTYAVKSRQQVNPVLHHRDFRISQPPVRAWAGGRGGIKNRGR